MPDDNDIEIPPQPPKLQKVNRRDKRDIRGWINVEHSDPYKLIRTHAWLMSAMPQRPQKPLGRQRGSKEKANEGRDEWIFKRMQKLISKGRNRDDASVKVSFELTKQYHPLTARSVRNVYDKKKRDQVCLGGEK